MPGALSGFRIIECGEMVSAAYASKLMADMGAEVIKIESPHGGDTARQRGSVSRRRATRGKERTLSLPEHQ